jgi:hypothetical protein
MADQEIPAEVRAAQRALGRSAVPAEAPTPPAATSTPTSRTATVDHVLMRILKADQVDIIGVFPSQCASRLMELQAELGIRANTASPKVRYFTPSNSRMALYRDKENLGPIVRNWVAGINEIRNWVRPEQPIRGAESRLRIYQFNDIYLDCIVATQTGNSLAVTLISLPPELYAAGSSDEPAAADLFVAEMPEDQVSQFVRYRDRLLSHAYLMVTRHILCRAENSLRKESSPGDEFEPIILKLHPHRTPTPEGAVSIGSLIAVCCSTARGDAILLKERTSRNSYDDLGKLSLLSERVLAEDMSDPISGALDPSDDRALEQLWLRSGRPAEFEVPELAFRRAAQRELFLSCGLDVPAERLKRRGACLVEREAENTYLGLYIYRLDLLRDASFDELAYAQAWDSDLKLVLMRDLYDPEMRAQLNRLLRSREGWLRKAVFAGTTAPGSELAR